MKNLFNRIYEGKTVFVTGHTGFKGSWLIFWLKKLGAKVIGYSLPSPTIPSHFELMNLNMTSIVGDIRDKKCLEDAIVKHSPDILFHIAAQPLVRFSYSNPLETLETNIIGTANVFEACRKSYSLKAIVNITSDKCYENKEWIWGYRENDAMGGHDPYSVSKGCAELITSCYRNSFFQSHTYNNSHTILLASARAGNVVGGGDWAEDRIIPDIIRAVNNNKPVVLRNPNAIRPWQHVLEPLSGYLTIGWKLLEGKKEYADAWNFGPINDPSLSVLEIVKLIQKSWEHIKYEIENNTQKVHEANFLKLDCSKAQSLLNWRSVWDIKKTFASTISWYKNLFFVGEINTESDLTNYVEDAAKRGLEWASFL